VTNLAPWIFKGLKMAQEQAADHRYLCFIYKQHKQTFTLYDIYNLFSLLAGQKVCQHFAARSGASDQVAVHHFGDEGTGCSGQDCCSRLQQLHCFPQPARLSPEKGSKHLPTAICRLLRLKKCKGVNFSQV
jgi:hypothetical protein